MAGRSSSAPARATRPLFLVGAGFSLAANQYFDASDPIAQRYPLTRELAEACFGRGDASASIETRFAQARADNDSKPVTALVELIQSADNSCGRPAARREASVYNRLLDQFAGANFISYNYDALLELCLFRRGAWLPWDGFGVPVESGNEVPTDVQASTSVVMHPHGSILLYGLEFSDDGQRIQLLDEPRILFDPGPLIPAFDEFRPGDVPEIISAIEAGGEQMHERIIAPMPSKEGAMSEGYLPLVMRAAEALIKQSTYLVAVGYSFSELDRSSFASLLEIARKSNKPLHVVDPFAEDIVKRLKVSFPKLAVTPYSLTLEEWDSIGFRLKANPPGLSEVGATLRQV